MKKVIRWIIKAGFTVLLFLLIFSPGTLGIRRSFVAVGLGDLRQEIAEIQAGRFVPWMVFAILAQAAGIFCSMLRWNLLLKGQGIFLPFPHLAGTFLTGRFFGTFLPGTLGLDGYRLFDTARHTGKIVESTTVIVIEKLIGFIALTFLVFLTLPFGARILQFKPLVLVAILVVLGSFVAVSFLMLFHPKLIRLAIGLLPIPFRAKLEGKIHKISLAVSAYAGQRLLLLKAVGLGICVHAGAVFMYFGTAMAVRAANIQMSDILFAAPLMIYGTVLGPSIGGEGIREIVFIALLGARTGTATAFLFSHLGFWVGELLSIAGGVIYLLRPPAYKPKMILKDLQELRARGRDAGEVDREERDFQEHLAAARNIARHYVRAAVAAGLYAGALVGLADGALVLHFSPHTEEYHALWYGVLLYGAVGLFLALAVSFAGGLVSAALRWNTGAARAFGVTFGVVLIALGLPIARFRIQRDLLAEQPLSLLQNLGLLAAAAVVFAFCAVVLTRFFRWPGVKRLHAPTAGTAVFAAIFALALGGAFAFAPVPPAPSAPRSIPPALAERPNVILVIVDTLRADHVSAYGCPKPLTSNLDSLARDGVVYKTLIAQASWTKPSIATILTGLYPSAHRATGKASVLPFDVVTLAEALRDAGYTTGGIVTNINLSPLFQFDQGFDDYRYLAPDHFFHASESASRLLGYSMLRLVRERFLSKRIYHQHYYQDSTAVHAAALPWLERHKDGRFFLLLHYMEPHDPYFEHPYNGVGIARVQDPDPPANMAERMRALYEGEVAYWDEHFGTLLAHLKTLGLYDDALILVTADHGEEFFEHGGWWHGTTLYEEQVNVPLVVKWPKNRGAGGVVTQIVRTIDIVPTILEATGAKKAPAMLGVPLQRDPATWEGHDRTAFAEEDFEGNVLHMIRTPEWKWITANPGNPRGVAERELFDLTRDPKERENLAERPDLAGRREALAAMLGEARARAETGKVEAATTGLSEEECQRLKALGYLTGDAPCK